MAFLAPLVEAGAEAGGAAEAGEAASGGGMMSKIGGLFKAKPTTPVAGEANKQQNVGESRTFNFQDAANTVRGALRPGSGGVD